MSKPREFYYSQKWEKLYTPHEYNDMLVPKDRWSTDFHLIEYSAYEDLEKINQLGITAYNKLKEENEMLIKAIRTEIEAQVTREIAVGGPYERPSFEVAAELRRVLAKVNNVTELKPGEKAVVGDREITNEGDKTIYIGKKHE